LVEQRAVNKSDLTGNEIFVSSPAERRSWTSGIYKEYVIKDLVNLFNKSEQDANTLVNKYYDTLVKVWRFELNTEHFADEIVRLDAMVDYDK